MFNRLLSACLFVSISFTCYAQNAETLQWRVKPGDSIVYKTIMKAQRDPDSKVQVPELFKNLKGDSTNGFDFQKQIQELQKMEPDYFITSLKRGKKGIIDIEMVLPETNAVKDTSQMANLYQMMSKLSGGVMLRGAVYENGDIQSFYLRYDQKNLIALFFQLPGKPVKVGDSWSINTNLISMDQSFKCDSAYKRNNVSVTAIDNTGTDKIVTVKYDIEEYITGTFGLAGGLFGGGDGKMVMEMTHKAIAKFSVTKGRWLTYDGVMETHSSSALMGGDSKKTFSLIAQ